MSNHTDNQDQLSELVTSVWASVTSYHPTPINIVPHFDFISFLAVAQHCKIDFFPITWQPALDIVGAGATARISQSFINLQVSFAFKRTTISNYPQVPLMNNRTFQALMSEISVLSHPSVRAHPNIINLEGICWEIPCDGKSALPVLVFEKAQLGDMEKFMYSDHGKELYFEVRLELCVHIAAAVTVMHSCNIIHGDIKPQNVLIFKDNDGKPIAKLADFGYSTVAATEGELIRLPNSRPWNAPEHHHRGFLLSASKKMDAYSFGMFCLWVLFNERFTETSSDFLESVKLKNAIPSPMASLEERLTHNLLEELKSKDTLLDFAHHLTTTTTSLSSEQKSALNQFFSLTLTTDPYDRSSDFNNLVHLLTQQRTPLAPTTGLDDRKISVPHASFQIATSLPQLCLSEYLVRRHIVNSLELQAKEHPCRCCKLNAAFQVALCLKIGFGIRRNENQAAIWLEISKRDDLEGVVEAIRLGRPGFGFRNQFLASFQQDGTSITMDYTNEYRKIQHLEDAELEYTAEIQDMQMTLGDRHPLVLALKGILVHVLWGKGEIGRSITLQTEIKEDLENDPNYGPEDRDTLMAANNLALLLKDGGKYHEAELLHRKAVEGFERTLGKGHLSTINSVENLASVLHILGKEEEAEKMHRQVLEGRQRVLGDEHRQTLISANNLALALQNQGKFKAAEDIGQKALEKSEKVLGKDHPHTIASINNMASLFCAQAKYEMAEKMSRQAVQYYEKAMGNEHPDTLISISGLASILQKQGKYEAAEEMNRRVIQGRENLLGRDHPSYLASVNNLATVLEAQGKYGDAAEMHQRVLEGRERGLGKGHPETLHSLNNLASVLRHQGKYEAAEEMNRRALEGLEKLLGREHPSTLASAHNLALVLQGQGKFASAEELSYKSLRSTEILYGEEHPLTLMSLANLALLLEAQGKHEIAEDMIWRVMQGQKKVLGTDHLDTLATTSNLATMLARDGKVEVAEGMY